MLRSYANCALIRVIAVCTLAAALELCGCGSGHSPANTVPASAADFSLSASAIALTAPVGTTTAALTLTATPLNGFSGTVSVQVQSLPTGVTAEPASFTLQAGASQQVKFALSASAPVGTATVQFQASSGSVIHSTQIQLTAEALVRTYTSTDGKMLYLESGNAVDTARVGLYTDWGGSIIEVSVNGVNYVNWHDTGREVQISFRTSGDLNWNPTLGGDNYDHGTPVIAVAVTSNSLYIKAQPIQWFPDFYGGGANQTVPGDMLVEQTVTAVASSPHTFKVHYKITHLGSDVHATGGQEFPAVYTNQDYIRFVSYRGSAPWTNDSVTISQFPNLGDPNNPSLILPERWGALVNAQDQGLTVYSPSSGPVFIGFVSPDPGAGGPTDNATNYFAALWNWTITPQVVAEADMYLIAGDYRVARPIVYQLHQGAPARDNSVPYINIDSPRSGDQLSGLFNVSGWAFDDTAVATVAVTVDGTIVGTADYGQPRPDVAQAYPGLSPVDVGFSYALDTTKISNGPHRVSARAADTSGNVAIAADAIVSVAN
jgi:Bacterial Ig domain